MSVNLSSARNSLGSATSAFLPGQSGLLDAALVREVSASALGRASNTAASTQEPLGTIANPTQSIANSAVLPAPGSSDPLNAPNLANITNTLEQALGMTTSQLQSWLGLDKKTIKPRADFNNDGYLDLFWRNAATGENQIWFMQPSGFLNVAPIKPLAGANWRVQGIEDFNGDRSADLLWFNQETSEARIWLMRGLTQVSEVVLAKVSPVWKIQATGDFNADQQIDLVWRNTETGQNLIWWMKGTTLSGTAPLPTLQGANLSIRAVGDFNQDKKLDILWQNSLSGEELVWWMNGTTVTATERAAAPGAAIAAVTDWLATVSDDRPTLPAATTSTLKNAFEANLNYSWSIQQIADFDQNGSIEVLWRNLEDGTTQLTDGATLYQFALAQEALQVNWQVALQPPVAPTGLVTIENLTFSGNEADSGTFQIRLNRTPTTPVTLTLNTGAFLVVDADANIRNGTQNTITFTAADWNRARTVSFIAERDGAATDRLTGNLVSYTLSGGLTGTASYEIASVRNTYAPDAARFNITLDFRNDYEGFWTPARRAVAQKAADDWATFIVNEWRDLTLNNTIGRLETTAGRPYSFTTKQYVDDLLVFINPYQGTGTEAGFGGPDYEFGGWITSPELAPRVGQIAIRGSDFAQLPDLTLYQIVAHELGHTLGLTGLNWTGYNLIDRTNPASSTFNGVYSRIANGGRNIPMQSQDGGDFAHPANSVRSIMSYGYLYQLTSPSQIDYAMLADSGYRVRGINVQVNT